MNTIHTATVEALQREFLQRHPEEAARQLEALPPPEIAETLGRQQLEVRVAVVDRMATDVGVLLLNAIPEAEATEILARLDIARAAQFLAGLEDERRDQVLAGLEPRLARNIQTVLSYPPQTAGSIMDPRVSLFRPDMTVADAIARLRELKRRNVRVVFTVDGENRLVGLVEVQDLALADLDTRLSEIARPIAAAVNDTAHQDEVVRAFDQYRLTDLPVIDLDGRLIGVVRYSALVTAAQEQASARFQTMVGVSRDERALSKVTFAVRKRLPWLEINLLTAFLAASVVGLFESTIAQFTALAVLLPVVAGQSGNTGAQALAVVMRGIALREVFPAQWLRILWKETGVGFLNGVVIALTTGAGVLIWSGSIGLAGVISVAMVISMVMAGAAGAAIPLILTVIGQDPAQSSSIILTTVTDVVGFFSFLGIATLMAAFL